MTNCPLNNPLSMHHREFPDQRIQHEFFLRTGDSQRIFVRLIGHAKGTAVLLLHGGPGSGSSLGMSAPFDLDKHLLIMIDQRGCGRSRPQGRLRQNNTQQLLNDIERVRQHLHIKQWHVYGGSWGATLALVYAGAHPGAVRSLVLRSLFLATPNEVRNLLYRTRLRRPKAWQHLANLTEDAPVQDLLTMVHKGLQEASPKAGKIAQAYSNLERALLMPYKPIRQPRLLPAQAQALRIKYLVQTHYLLQHCFLSRSYLVQQAQRAYQHGISGVAIHGKNDPLCPVSNMAWLQRHMPSMRVEMVPAQHLAHEPAIHEALKSALLTLT